MKAVLTTNEEFQVSLVAMQSENQLCVAFVGVTDYKSLREKLTIDAMKELKFYSSDESYDVYEGFTEFVSPARLTALEDDTFNVVTYFNKENPLVTQINDLQTIVATLTSK